MLNNLIIIICLFVVAFSSILSRSERVFSLKTEKICQKIIGAQDYILKQKCINQAHFKTLSHLGDERRIRVDWEFNQKKYEYIVILKDERVLYIRKS